MITNGYIAIFICFITKSVHIEVVTSSNTGAFLPALRHFTAYRVKPKTIYSENGNKFQGAANEQHEIYKMLQSTSQMARVQDILATEKCKYKFIPQHGPHFGGLWEATVKSMKYHLQRILGAHVATYEELSTLLAEIQPCLHSRSLCALSSDPLNTTYLFLDNSNWQTTAQLTLLTTHTTYFPDGNLPTTSNSFVNDCHPTIYRVFNSQLWQRTSPNLQPGEQVLFREGNTIPLQWPTAVFTNIHPYQVASYA